MKVTVPNFANFEPDEALIPGKYGVTINKASVESDQKGTKLKVEYLIQSGPEQPSGNPDPTGRIISEVISLSNFSNMKDGGKFIMTKLSHLLKACEVEKDETGSFDPDEMLQANIFIITTLREDQNGLPRENIFNYSKD